MRKMLRLANCGFNPSNKLQWGGCWYLEWNGYTLLAATFSNFLRGDFFLWRQPITRINKTRHQHSGPRPRYKLKSGMKTMECRPCPVLSYPEGYDGSNQKEIYFRPLKILQCFRQLVIWQMYGCMKVSHSSLQMLVSNCGKTTLQLQTNSNLQRPSIGKGPG